MATDDTRSKIGRLIDALNEADEMTEDVDLVDAWWDTSCRDKLDASFEMCWDILIRLNWILNSREGKQRRLGGMPPPPAPDRGEPVAAATGTGGDGDEPSSAEPTANVKKPRRQRKREVFEQAKERLG